MRGRNFDFSKKSAFLQNQIHKSCIFEPNIYYPQSCISDPKNWSRAEVKIYTAACWLDRSTIWCTLIGRVSHRCQCACVRCWRFGFRLEQEFRLCLSDPVLKVLMGLICQAKKTYFQVFLGFPAIPVSCQNLTSRQMANFGQFLAKMGKTGFFQKSVWNFLFTLKSHN